MMAEDKHQGISKSLFKLWIFEVNRPQKSRFSGSFGGGRGGACLGQENSAGGGQKNKKRYFFHSTLL
jgi:hypothetical protein